MDKVPNIPGDGERINDSGQSLNLASRVAIRNSFDLLAKHVRPADRAAAVQALRYPEADLTDVDMDIVLAAYFDGAELPPGAKDLDPTPCPPWCDKDNCRRGDGPNEWEPGHLHSGVLLDERNAEGDGVFIDTSGEVRVELVRYDNALTGAVGTPNITITGEQVNPDQARRVVEALTRATELIEGVLQ